MTIEILLDKTIYNNRLNLMKVKYGTNQKLSPKEANSIVYRMFGDMHVISQGHELYKKLFAIKKLNDKGFEAIYVFPVPENTAKERAEKYGLKVCKIEYLSDISVPNLSNAAGVKLKFTSPTCFKFERYSVPAFDSYVFWSSVLASWYSCKQHQPLLNASQLITLIYPVETKIKQINFKLDTDISFYGFVGSVKMLFDNKAIGDIRLFIYYLLETAAWIGAGKKTAWGMGNVDFQLL